MHYEQPQPADLALLDLLTCSSPPSPTNLLNLSNSPTSTSGRKFSRRDAALDPLLLAAASASGPHVTRHHYHHDFFPGVMLPKDEGSWDWTKFSGEDSKSASAPKRLTYVSRQAPRSRRLAQQENGDKENGLPSPLGPTDPNIPLSPTSRHRRSSVSILPSSGERASLKSESPSKSSLSPVAEMAPTPIHVRCMARTRIPTPHGPVFLHLYHNNKDHKEHLAIVVDPAQFEEPHSDIRLPPIRSESLDAVWSENETDMDRITRGAYVGRLSASSQTPSTPISATTLNDAPAAPAPLIRLHSECFTGETVGSMRCDCGEQLDEAIRQLSEPIQLTHPETGRPVLHPGRGVIVYLRQEGRGIGLLSKIRAYNLQDIGHDTVTANLMLGHQADERGYGVAAEILKDLGIGQARLGEGVRVLTNNPDKVSALEKEGLKVVERVPMVPRSWAGRKGMVETPISNLLHAHLPPHTPVVAGTTSPASSYFPSAPQTPQSHTHLNPHSKTKAYSTIMSGHTVYGEDLEKYLRTKVLKMGHMLPLWPDAETLAPEYPDRGM